MYKHARTDTEGPPHHQKSVSTLFSSCSSAHAEANNTAAEAEHEHLLVRLGKHYYNFYEIFRKKSVECDELESCTLWTTCIEEIISVLYYRVKGDVIFF